MNIVGIIVAVATVGGVGLLIGVFLSFFGNYFKVETDPKEDAVMEALPGNNCGGCGYAGCSGLAAAIAKGEAPVNGCPVGGENVAKVISQIMGVEADASKRMVAFVKCSGTCDKTTIDYEYHGVEDCRMLSFVPNGGPKSCNDGCLGYGSCVKACPFDAIHVLDGVAVVDKEKCKACSKCIAVCPKHLIELIPYDAAYAVACNSKEKGPVVMKECKQGCIGCGICVKQCQYDAVSVSDNIAYIDQEKCTGCGACSEKCPKKVIMSQS